jgi:cell division septation protein DedD
MKNNETGEFELVVGNKQLLSGFAIVVLLFGVGVAMGYILGQNSPRSAKLQPDAGAASVPPLAESRPQPASPVAPPPQPVSGAASDPSGAGSAESPAQPSTQPPASQPAPQTTTQPARDPAAAVPQPQSVVAAASPIPEAPPGNYWQVMALPQADAENVLHALQEQHFPALLSPGTKNLTRVLVGPFKDTQAMGRAKTQLESAGFHPVKKSSE